MGVNISFVRSMSLDSWSEIQLNRMEYGGNERLKQFWKDQKFPMGLTIQQKLDNKAMDRYRDNLLKLAKSELCEVEPIPFIGYHQTIPVNNHKSEDKIKSGFGNN